MTTKLYQDKETEHISRFKEGRNYNPMTTPKNKRLPKARVMYADPVADCYGPAPRFSTQKDYWHTDVCAFIPCPTAAKARQIVRAAPFLNMTEEEQADRIARILAPDCGKHTAEVTLAVIAAIHGGAR